MNIYVAFFLLLIALFILYRLMKIRKQFHRVVSREDKVIQYCSTGIRSWPTATATLDSVEVQQPTSSTFQLATTLLFEVNGQQYSCTTSPYNELTTTSNKAALSLRDDIMNSGEYFVYYNPDNAQESFYIVNGFLSWSDYQLLVKNN